MEIVKYPNSILLANALPVLNFDEHLHVLLDDMKKTMNDNNGLGLAANQVGHLKSIFIMQSVNKRNDDIIEFINPLILNKEGNQRLAEGCLSAPGIYVTVDRAEQVIIDYQDRYGNMKKGILEGLESVIVQHEVGHLNGEFFLDKASRNDRRAALKKLGIR